jgi:cyclophilin family peptidyl-prolyl cis-trans isomerase
VGTEKRDRQRANRDMKKQQQARAQTRQRSTRVAIVVIGAIVGVIAIAFVANTFIGDDGDSGASDTLAPVTSDIAVSAGVVDATTGEFVPEGCPPPEGTADQTQKFDAAPPMCLDPNVAYSAVVDTNMGEITIALDQATAPATVNSFVFLARNKYFDATICHRIIPGFVVQCGDPTGTGTGDPGYEFADELPTAGEYKVGSIAMANSGADTNGSQFFIITGDAGVALPPAYSLFGEVTSGFDDTVVQMEAVGTQSGTPSEPVEINSVTIQVN